jgi:hypothetical protein
MSVLESGAAYELLNTVFQDSVLQLGAFQETVPDRLPDSG